uniref:Uncharacterized protein n=1 Tax=Callorhinchus milii TaxID=7868 RepID=A0A4W3GS98_CALMI
AKNIYFTLTDFAQQRSTLRSNLPLLEIGFKCPNDPNYNRRYSYMFLLGPSFALILLTALLTKDCLICCSNYCLHCRLSSYCCYCKCSQENNCRCSSRLCERCLHLLTSICKVCYYGMVWIIVVFLDGSCYSCLQSSQNDTFKINNTKDFGQGEEGKQLISETVSRVGQF